MKSALHGPAVRLALAGEASIPARDLDLKGVASLVMVSANAKPFELPFAVQGAWDDPLLLPDAQILIQRSGAAAPLLEALRARRDAVREPAVNSSETPVINQATPIPPAIPLAKEASTAPTAGSATTPEPAASREPESKAPVGAGLPVEPQAGKTVLDSAPPAPAPAEKTE